MHWKGWALHSEEQSSFNRFVGEYPKSEFSSESTGFGGFLHLSSYLSLPHSEKAVSHIFISLSSMNILLNYCYTTFAHGMFWWWAASVLNWLGTSPAEGMFNVAKSDGREEEKRYNRKCSCTQCRALSAFVGNFMKSLRTCCYWRIILHTGKYTWVTGRTKLTFKLSTNLGCCWVLLFCWAFFRTVFSVFSYSYFRSLKRSRHKSLRHFYMENKCHIKHSALLSTAFRQVRSHVRSQSCRQVVLMNPPNQGVF